LRIRAIGQMTGWLRPYPIPAVHGVVEHTTDGGKPQVS
jgi:hypothetical protein